MAHWTFKFLYVLKGMDRVDSSKSALAKIMLLFFAVLFTAVLIHPDVDLLDVHDVKITSARSQLPSIQKSLVQRASFLLGRPLLDPASPSDSLHPGHHADPYHDLHPSGILRI